MYERFTDRARRVMGLANQEAQHFNHEYIGTEHILLGLVKEGSGVAAAVLKNLGIDLRMVRLEVEKLVQTGPEMVAHGKLPHTPRAKKVIEYAMEEARKLGHNYVGTEHMLLGLLREQEGVAAQVLMNLGLKLGEVRNEVLSLLGHGMDPAAVEEESRPQRRSALDYLRHADPISDEAWEIFAEGSVKEAERFNHGSVSTAHLLLALVEHESLPGKVLRELGVTAETARRAMTEMALEYPPWQAAEDVRPTSGFSAALEAAAKEARGRSPTRELEEQLEELPWRKEEAIAHQDFETAACLRDQADQIKRQLRQSPDPPWSVEPAHLLLGLFSDPRCLAVRMIQNLGLHPEQVRTELLRRLGDQAAG